VLRTGIRRWLRAGIIVAAIFVAWFALGVLTYNDDFKHRGNPRWSSRVPLGDYILNTTGSI